MHAYRSRLAGLLLVLAATLGGCAQMQAWIGKPTRADLVRAFVRIDRAYIAAVTVTREGGTVLAGVAVSELQTEWRNFAKAFADFAPEEPGWKRDLQEIDATVQHAGQFVRARDVAEAHEALLAVRPMLMRLRRRVGIDYYIDRLVRFGGAIDTILTVVRDKTPDMLSAADVGELRGLLAEARRRWADVRGAPFDPRLFGFDKPHLARMEQFLKAEDAALERLAAALKADDRERILRAAWGLGPPFAGLYKLFGNFSIILLQESGVR
jgi:hypothetical protein